MTNEEAYKIFYNCNNSQTEETATAKLIAEQALLKQIPKKPIKLPDNEQYIRYTDTYRCPTCGENFSGTGVADYCYHCGQRLDWCEQK